MYVSDTEALQSLVDMIRPAGFVTIDTEFMRERTYWPKLCLIQVGTDDVHAIIDPLAFDDLSPLWDLLSDPAVLKVMHAGSQDMEIFYQVMDTVPAPTFDTQIAATLAGFPQQVGYGAIVQEIAGVTLDKSDTFTDWAKRPLSSTQIEYALNDVRYLPQVYRKLRDDLARQGRQGWLEPDFARLTSPETYEVVPENQYKRVKRYKSLNRRQMGVLQKVAAWREFEAQRRDIPRKWVLGDESLIEVARRSPDTSEKLRVIRGVTDKLQKSAYGRLIEAVQTGLAMSDDELPFVERKHRPVGDIDGAVDLMSALVRLRAHQQGIAVPLLASRSNMERLARGDREDNPLMEGWRKSLIGDELLLLLAGKISLSARDGLLVVTTESDDSEPNVP